jgi:hypothetical protein
MVATLKRLVHTQSYWWVCAVDRLSGRPIVQGHHSTESDARQWGFENIRDNDFEVHCFPTINKVAARDFWKSILLERTKSLSTVLQRAIYPK